MLLLISIAVILLSITDMILTYRLDKINKNLEETNKRIDSPMFGKEEPDDLK